MATSNSFPPQHQSASHVRLILKIVLLYFAVTVSLIGLVEYFGLPLITPDGRATQWRLIVEFWYYVLPPVLGALLGAIFRPFWKNAFRFYVFVVLLQFAASLALYGLRDHYLRSRQDNVSQSFMAVVRFTDFLHKFIDQNDDGVVDKVELEGQCHIENLPPGEYVVGVVVAQGGKPLPPAPVTSERQAIRESIPKDFRMKFSFDPQIFSRHFAEGALEMRLTLKKILSPDRQARRIVFVNRWAPFLRTTTWGGYDDILQEQVVDLDISQTVDSFQLLPLGNPPSR